VTSTPQTGARSKSLRIPAGRVQLEGDLALPQNARGLVIFVHGSGSSRRSPRNRRVAARLRAEGFGTLLFDLLTPEEEREDEVTRALRFDIPLLAERLEAVTRWLAGQAHLPSWRAYFGASTGAAAALVAAAAAPDLVAAVVSRGGRPDLAGAALGAVHAATLLIVGSRDTEVLALNEAALAQLKVTKALAVVERATHLFEEPGALDAACDATIEWLDRIQRTDMPRNLEHGSPAHRSSICAT
jgi:dienelactone hydrolase